MTPLGLEPIEYLDSGLKTETQHKKQHKQKADKNTKKAIHPTLKPLLPVGTT